MIFPLRAARWVCAILFLSSLALARAVDAPKPVLDRPKLVVGLVIDQMRWDFLYRYTEHYGPGGFKRLLGQGFSCEDTRIDYLPTYTGCGHASIFTGSVPAIHGITGNNFILQQTGQPMYCVADPDVSTVGSSSKAGQMSPKNLLTTTIGDELRLATNFRSKVVALAIKDRGSILSAGHSADSVYWYDPSGDGQWITSTYYRDSLPGWVSAFNEKHPASSYLKDDWRPLLPESAYTQSERAGNSILPAAVSTKPDPGKVIAGTPFGNTMSLDLAREAVLGESLGQDEFTDLLAISLSSPDYVGHQFGPNSIEVQDLYIRLDAEIAKFLTFLDSTVGEGNYLVFLTADHGVAHSVEFLRAHKIPAGLFSSSLMHRALEADLAKTFNTPNLVLKIQNAQVSLNRAALRAANLDETTVARAAAAFLRGKAGISDVFLTSEISGYTLPEPIKQRVVKGFHPARSGQVQFILQPGWYDAATPTGTTHGSWSPYDSHIPLLWFGAGIKKGELHRPTHMSDIAPTLAALLKIQAPSGSIGQAIPEVLQARTPPQSTR